MKLADFILYLTDTWQVPSGSRQVPQGKEKTTMSIASGDALIRSSKAGCEALRIIFLCIFWCFSCLKQTSITACQRNLLGLEGTW